jgi:YhcH/YjgK/YiaL family protein
MILDSLENTQQYYVLHPLFEKAFNFIKQTDFSQLPEGKIETDDPRLYFSVIRIRGKEMQDAMLETHQKFIDIQAPLAGVETIGWKASNNLMIISEPYNENKDITFYHDYPTTYTKLFPGQFAIYFPDDAHSPGIGQGDIRKVIAKIAVIE